jgi:PTH1 family peptidyl-tRNA hydrolase
VDRLAGHWEISLGRDPSTPFTWGEGVWGGWRVVLAKPLIYMNRSGTAVRALMQKLDCGPEQLLVLHDELDLPLGRLKFKERGGDGGHRGVRSIISSLGTDHFLRLRIGIGRPPPGVKAADYVLSPFEEEECTLVEQVLDRVVEALQTFLEEGLQKAMNRYHTASDDSQRGEKEQLDG